MSAENTWPQLLLKFRGTWKDFFEVLIKDVLSSLIQVGAEQYTTLSHGNVLEHCLNMAGTWVTTESFPFDSLDFGGWGVHPALPDSGQELSKMPPQSTHLSLKGYNTH